MMAGEEARSSHLWIPLQASTPLQPTPCRREGESWEGGLSRSIGVLRGRGHPPICFPPTTSKNRIRAASAIYQCRDTYIPPRFGTRPANDFFFHDEVRAQSIQAVVRCS